MFSYMWHMHVWGWHNHVYMFIRVVYVVYACVCGVRYNHVDMFRCACICGICVYMVLACVHVHTCLCMWGMWGLEVMLGVFPNLSHLIFEAKSLTELILPIQGALGSPISRVMGTCYHAQLSWGAWRLDLSTSLMAPPAQCPVP